MRYEASHNEMVRERIVKAASRLFRRRGIAATGLASVMKDAGLTVGAFYTHFKSKQELVAAAVDDAAEERLSAFKPEEQGGKGLKASLETYLSAAHRDKPETGCMAVAYGSEIPRQSGATRRVFASTVEELIGTIAAQLPQRSDAERRQLASVIYAMMTGAAQLSRCVERGVADEILSHNLDFVLRLMRPSGASEVER